MTCSALRVTQEKRIHSSFNKYTYLLGPESILIAGLTRSYMGHFVYFQPSLQIAKIARI